MWGSNSQLQDQDSHVPLTEPSQAPLLIVSILLKLNHLISYQVLRRQKINNVLLNNKGKVNEKVREGKEKEQDPTEKKQSCISYI